MKIKMNKTVGSYVKDKVYEIVNETRNTYVVRNDSGFCMSINKRNCEPVGFKAWLNKIFK